LTLLAAMGFEDIEITERFDCFRGTAVRAQVPPKVWPHGANVRARCPS
jgi:hypothetical protein